MFIGLAHVFLDLKPKHLMLVETGNKYFKGIYENLYIHYTIGDSFW